MAKKEKQSMVDEGDAGEAIPPVADPIEEQLIEFNAVIDEINVPGEIHSQAQAEELVHSGRFPRPEGVKMAYVTQDSNVFWPANANSAVNHSQRNNLKLFTVTCQD
jgi:hypothetical protein